MAVHKNGASEFAAAFLGTQELLHDAMTTIQIQLKSAKGVSTEDIGSFNPVWDIGAAKHEHAPARLFIS